MTDYIDHPVAPDVPGRDVIGIDGVFSRRDGWLMRHQLKRRPNEIGSGLSLELVAL